MSNTKSKNLMQTSSTAAFTYDFDYNHISHQSFLRTVEKSKSTGDHIPEAEIEKLKEHIRLCTGLALTIEERRKKIDFTKPPNTYPKSNWTHKCRLELQKHKAIRRKKYDERYKKSLIEFMKVASLSAESTYCEYIENSEEIECLEKLKQLSLEAKKKQPSDYKSNKNSQLRLKALHNEPIITTYFKNTFEVHQKAPFVMARRIEYPKRYQMPKLEGKNKVWLYPFEFYEGDIPLQYQKKPITAGKPPAKKKLPPPKGSSKLTQKTRPGLAKKTKPPWNYGVNVC